MRIKRRRKPSAATKRKISKSLTGRVNRPRTDTEKEKISKGVKASKQKKELL